MKRRQLPALTGLRFAIALLVVLVHFGQPAMPQGVLRDLAASGAQGVPLFFVLSGFILTYVHSTGTGERQVLPGPFYRSRIARLYPVYLAGLLLALPTLPWQPAWSAGVQHVTPSVVAVSTLTMTQAWWPFAGFVWNSPGWSLSAEMLFYALFPFVLGPVCRLSLNRVLLLLVIAFAGTQIAPLAYAAISPDPGAYADFPLWLDVALFNPLVHLPSFLFGMGVGRLFVLRPEGSVGSGTAPLVALVLTLWALVHATHFTTLTGNMMVRDGLLVPLYGLLIYTLAWQRGPLCALLSRPSLVLLGESSYALYILHWPLHAWLVRIAGVSDAASQASPVFVGCYLALLIAAAIWVHKAVEIPMRALIGGTSRRARGG